MAGRDDATRRVKLTYADFVQLPDDGMRHEVIAGEHYVTPSPTTRHQRILGRLHVAISRWLEDHPIGEVFLAPLDVVLSPHDVVEPDLFYVSSERIPLLITDKNAQGADLAVEILSPGTRARDETLKRELYARSGMAEYWLVDPDANAIRAYRTSDPDIARDFQAVRDDTLTTQLLPGFQLALRRLFRP